MKKTNSRTNLHIAIVGLILLLGLCGYCLIAPVSKVEETISIYIDEDDTQDSVVAKILPSANKFGMTTLNMLIRHSNYAEHIRKCFIFNLSM